MNRLEQIDRTIFELLRLAVVGAGYLPDVTLMADQDAYVTAKDALRATVAGGQLIEVFGVGTSDARGEKTVCKITIDRRGTKSDMEVGVWPEVSYSQSATPAVANTTYTRKIGPAGSKTLIYEIRMFANTRTHERIMTMLIENTFGRRRYIAATIDGDAMAGYLFSGPPILMVCDSDVDVSSTDLVERLYIYNVPDVYLEDEQVLEINVPAMSTINYDLYYTENDSISGIPITP